MRFSRAHTPRLDVARFVSGRCPPFWLRRLRSNQRLSIDQRLNKTTHGSYRSSNVPTPRMTSSVPRGAATFGRDLKGRSHVRRSVKRAPLPSTELGTHPVPKYVGTGGQWQVPAWRRPEGRGVVTPGSFGMDSSRIRRPQLAHSWWELDHTPQNARNCRPSQAHQRLR